MPTIVFNGNPIDDPSAMQDMFEKEMPPTHHEVQSYDCHILNEHFATKELPATRANTGKNISVLVLVNGYVRYGETRQEPTRGFSESIVLVPNTEIIKGRPKNGFDFLIQSQNFRMIV